MNCIALLKKSDCVYMTMNQIKECVPFLPAFAVLTLSEERWCWAGVTLRNLCSGEGKSATPNRDENGQKNSSPIFIPIFLVETDQVQEKKWN
jgi:hypothetical protein